MEAPTVFISYSHKDEAWKDRLQPHLVMLQQAGHLEVWQDRRIGYGAEWYDQIKDVMERADVAVIEQARSSRGITLGDNVWLGTGAKVLDGVRLGSNVVVGANGVVNSDLPDGAIAAGVPARILRTRDEREISEP